MKKLLSMLICLLFVWALAMPAVAAPEGPQITLQPQNYHYPQYSVAIYTVKATGTNLRATWYLEYEGKTYNISDNQNGFEPWEGYAGETYGPMENGPETFSWFFGGIDEGLSGAEIWCVIEDGHYDVTSERAIITVQGAQMPPEILQNPAAVSVSRTEEAEIRCVARSGSDAQLGFQWYETTTGRLQDIRAIDGENSDFMICSTETTGTRYYVCCVSDSRGGTAYSSVVPVSVTDSKPAPQGKAPVLQTKELPKGSVGEDYGFILETDDYAAEFSVAYNPNGANDFEKTGLKLSIEGMLMGKLTKAGTYTFTICVSNAYGEDYGNLTLEVVDPSKPTPATTPEAPPETTVVTTPETSPETTAETLQETVPQTIPAETQPREQTPVAKKAGFPWWGYLLIGLLASGGGVGVAVWMVKKKS